MSAPNPAAQQSGVAGPVAPALPAANPLPRLGNANRNIQYGDLSTLFAGLTEAPPGAPVGSALDLRSKRHWMWFDIVEGKSLDAQDQLPVDQRGLEELAKQGGDYVACSFTVWAVSMCREILEGGYSVCTCCD